MYRRILLGVDPGGLAECAVPVVAALAKRSGADVVVLSVFQKDEETAARQLAAGVAGELAELGVGARIDVTECYDGHVGREIAAVAEAVGADLIALGSHGHSDLAGLFAGSVGHEVAASSSCAVLLVRSRSEAADLEASAALPPIRTVLLGVDASPESEAAVEAAIEVARQHGARVVVAHVRESIFAAEAIAYVEPADQAEEVLDQPLRRLEAAGVRGEKRLLPGSWGVARELAGAADAVEADLIVLGSRRLTDIGGLLLGSVAHQVLHLSRRPLLIAERAPARVPAGDSA